MSEQQFAFLVTELSRLSYECEKCGTVVVFDIMAMARKFGLPETCSTCGKDIEQVTKVIECYGRFYEEAQKVKTIQLRTKPTPVRA
jgi:DNA-directed RNA polymerase subunit RPC12/RpoP